MHAAHKLYKNSVLSALALAVVVAGPVLAQPQFLVSNSNVVLQGTGGTIVSVTSTGAAKVTRSPLLFPLRITPETRIEGASTGSV